MINPMDLSERTFLVTGASSGIGRETTILLSELGAKVVYVGRNREQLLKTAEMLSGDGHRSEEFDLTTVDDIPKWMNNLASEIGPLHGVVHSAGIHFVRPLRIMSSKSTEKMMRINVGAAIALSKGFRQKGVRRDEGSIVFLSSSMGIVGQPGVTDYSASKGAICAITKSLALELAEEKIRVNCVAPAIVKTEMVAKQQESLTTEQLENIKAMHPLGLGVPRDVANAIAFLLADTGRWITGITLAVDGGYTAH